MKIMCEITKKGYTISFKDNDKVVAEVKMLKIRGGARSVSPIDEQEIKINDLGFSDVFESIDRGCFDAMCAFNKYGK